uniref:Putative thioredoxin binding protein tbp-2/vdup1 n=1 Tax=Lutzomyia longipalpis TaxID=7200 RepID=A0A7G3B2Q7_LUTLO
MQIKVDVDSPEGMYFAGDKISGVVSINVDIPETLKVITVSLRGVAKIAFREGIMVPFFLASNNVYYDQQTVISREIIVFANASMCQIMEKGSYTFSFSFLLPNSMVTSFSASHGHVTYHIEAVVRKRFFTQRIRRELRIYQFNEDTPQLSYRPLSVEKVILPRISCFFPLFFTRHDARARCQIHIPRISFYAGEVIQVNISLPDYQATNTKSATMISELLQEFSFQGGLYNQRIVEPRKAIVSEKTQGINANHQLVVPICPRTGPLYRRARVNYYLSVRVVMMCRNYELILPVTISGPLNDMSRKWKSHYSHSSVSSETDLTTEETLRDQQRRANHLLRFLNLRGEFTTSIDALNIPEAVPEVDEESDEVAMMLEIEETPDIFATAIMDSTHLDNLEAKEEDSE